MKAVMRCDTCGDLIFYDDTWDDYACPKCGEEYERWTDEDTELFMKGIEIFFQILPFTLDRKLTKEKDAE